MQAIWLPSYLTFVSRAVLDNPNPLLAFLPPSAGQEYLSRQTFLTKFTSSATFPLFSFWDPYNVSVNPPYVFPSVPVATLTLLYFPALRSTALYLRSLIISSDSFSVWSGSVTWAEVKKSWLQITAQAPIWEVLATCSKAEGEPKEGVPWPMFPESSLVVGLQICAWPETCEHVPNV